MDRRSLLKGIAGAVGATVGAFAFRSGVDARESAPAGVRGRQVMPGTLTPITANPVITLSGPVGSDAGFTITYHSDSTATLECLWRIVNDPSYINYGRYGSDAESLARAGKMSVFPEYDARHPIEQWSRGHFYTYHVLGVWVNPDGYQYADSSIANQELTARALYVAHLARLQAETQSRITAPLQIVSGTSMTRTTYRQVTPFTTEQMVQLRDEHRALPNVFNAVVAVGPKEGGMYTVRVLCEIGNLGEIRPITEAPAFLSEPL